MTELTSQINPNSAEYKANYAANKALAEELAARQKQAATDRPPRVVELQRLRGKLLAHERIDANCHRWPPGICTTVRPPARASSPALVASPESIVSSSPTTRRSRAAPTSRKRSRNICAPKPSPRRTG